MLDGTYREGEAVVRIKTDLNHPNPAIRDWPALRIIDVEKYPHPRVGKQIPCLAPLQFRLRYRRPPAKNKPHN